MRMWMCGCAELGLVGMDECCGMVDLLDGQQTTERKHLAGSRHWHARRRGALLRDILEGP